MTSLTIYTRLAKHTSSECTQTRDCQAFAAAESNAVLSECPVIACSGVQENGDYNDIDDSSADFQLINTSSSPLLDQRLKSRNTSGVEVLPSAVRWDLVKVFGLAVALAEISRGEKPGIQMTVPESERRHSLQLHQVWMRESQNW